MCCAAVNGTRRLAFFGGSFDPVHLGHLAFALDLLELGHLERIYLCPTSQNPFKTQEPRAAAEHRLAMLQLALDGVDRLQLLDWEVKDTRPSYTVDTLKRLHRQLQRSGEPFELFIAMGADSAYSFYRWHQAEEIVQLATPLVGRRAGEGAEQLAYRGAPLIQGALLHGSLPTRIFEVSSSEVRRRLFEGKRVDHLLHPSVLHYIVSKGLYRHHGDL